MRYKAQLLDSQPALQLSSSVFHPLRIVPIDAQYLPTETSIYELNFNHGVHHFRLRSTSPSTRRTQPSELQDHLGIRRLRSRCQLRMGFLPNLLYCRQERLRGFFWSTTSHDQCMHHSRSSLEGIGSDARGMGKTGAEPTTYDEGEKA